MKRRFTLVAVVAVAIVGGSATGASAQHPPGSNGCLTVASKFLDETAPGHQGTANAATRGTGEGPCGFGEPPRQN